jgi:DNA-binding LacI/PurR family transcriptional regulator
VVVDYQSAAAPLDFLACDNAAAARRAVRHLAEDLGHRRIGFVAGKAKHAVHATFDESRALLVRSSSDTVERIQSVHEALAEHGLGREAVTFTSPELAVEACVSARRHGCTALLTCEETAALQLVRDLAQRGVRVPRDISVCAVAGASDALIDGRPLSYCRFDFVGMGREAVRLLAARCGAPGLDGPRIRRIGFEFVEGTTSAPPRGRGLRQPANKHGGGSR